MTSSPLGTRLPAYQQLAMRIKQRIKQGDYHVGSQLPPLRNLSAEYGASLNAVQRALRQLENERIVESRHGVGVWVTPQSDCRNTALLFGFIQPYYTLFSTQVYHHLESALENRANLCVMRTSHNDAQRERKIVEQLMANGINGVLLWPVDDDQNGPFLADVARRVPLVTVDRIIPGLEGPSVVLDYASAGADIVEWFFEQGCRRILFITDPLRISSYLELEGGIRQQIDKRGLNDGFRQLNLPLVDMVMKVDDGDDRPIEQGFTALSDLLRHQTFDAIICPQWTFVTEWFSDAHRAGQTQNVRIATLTSGTGHPRDILRMRRLAIIQWAAEMEQMLGRGMDLLQEMALTRKPLRLKVRVPFALLTLTPTVKT